MSDHVVGCRCLSCYPPLSARIHSRDPETMKRFREAYENDYISVCPQCNIVHPSLIDSDLCHGCTRRKELEDRTRKGALNDCDSLLRSLKLADDEIETLRRQVAALEKVKGVSIPRESLSPDRRNTVYFVRDGEFVKIGTTTRSVAGRLGDMKTGNPRGAEFRLLGTIEAGPTRESELHEKFRHLHHYREWFRADSELIDWISKNADAVMESR